MTSVAMTATAGAAHDGATSSAGAPAPRVRLLDRDALVDVAPLVIALVPFAAIIGVQSAADGRTAGSLAGTLLLYAGSAQVSTLSLLHQGAGLASILAAVALINARFVAYSAAMAPLFAEQPRWFRLLGPHFVIDQTFAAVTARGDLTGGTKFRRYWLTAGVTIGLAWVAAMTAGATLGPLVPHSPALAMMPAAVLAAFLGRALLERPAVVAVAAGVVAALVPLPAGERVLLGTTCGALAGFLAAKASRQ